MAKTRVGVVLREKIGTNKTTSRSTDLISLTERYNVWCQRIRSLIQSLEKHHAAMAQMENSRSLVAKSIATMSQNTPLWTATGLLPSADRPSSSVSSYSSINDILSAKTKNYTTKYKQFVIDYAIEWEKVVRTRIDTATKKAEELRRDLDHYRKKVEELRNTTNRSMTKGKQIKQEAQEKLRRNEEKLVAAKNTYNKVAHDLCILIEEVTERSWRDLHPLLVKVAQFDMTLAQDESQILSSLTDVVAKLKEISTAQGVSGQPRLKDFASLNPEQLSTRPGGVDTGLMLTIESSISTTPVSGMSGSPGGGLEDDMARPPGSVAPQGIGGFPVQVASSDPPGYQRRDSMSSQHSEPLTTLGMLAISNNAAPAPTLDDVYSLQNGDNASVYSTGALSAHNPTPNNHNYRRSVSMVATSSNGFGRSNSMTGGHYDDSSVYSAPAYGGSGAFPPPPSMPPPPPPSMPPPPPPPSTFGFGGPMSSSTLSFAPAPSSFYPPAAPGAFSAPAPYSYAPSGGFGGGLSFDPNPFGPSHSQAPPPLPSSFGPPPVSTASSGYNPTNPFE
ncbi:hypothetical protein ACA910_017167 [Epithemia clementina (nom. ined.)]